MIIDNYAGDSVVQTISDTIYISNLSKDVTEEKLAEKFGSLGMLKIDRKTQKPKSKLIKFLRVFLFVPVLKKSIFETIYKPY